MISWIIWTLFKPLDYLIERPAVRQQELNDEPKKDALPFHSHAAWLPLTETGPLGNMVAPKEKDASLLEIRQLTEDSRQRRNASKLG